MDENSCSQSNLSVHFLGPEKPELTTVASNEFISDSALAITELLSFLKGFYRMNISPEYFQSIQDMYGSFRSQSSECRRSARSRRPATVPLDVKEDIEIKREKRPRLDSSEKQTAKIAKEEPVELEAGTLFYKIDDFVSTGYLNPMLSLTEKKKEVCVSGKAGVGDVCPHCTGPCDDHKFFSEGQDDLLHLVELPFSMASFPCHTFESNFSCSQFQSIVSLCSKCKDWNHVECLRKQRQKWSSYPLHIPVEYINSCNPKSTTDKSEEGERPQYPTAALGLRDLCDSCLDAGIVDKLTPRSSGLEQYRPSRATKAERSATSQAIVCSRCWTPHLNGEGGITVHQQRRAALGIYDNSTDVWICSSCVNCSFCHSHPMTTASWKKESTITRPSFHSILVNLPFKEGRCSTPQPCLDFLLCNECLDSLDNNDICPVCSCPFDSSDNIIPMLACEVCDAWTHLSCDPTFDMNGYKDLKKEKYKNQLYLCPICRAAESSGLINKKDSNTVMLRRQFGMTIDLSAVPVFAPEPIPPTTNALLIHPDFHGALKAARRVGNIYLQKAGFLPYSESRSIITKDSLYPMGFSAFRWFQSYTIPTARTLYWLQISNSPINRFTLLAMDDPDNPLIFKTVDEWNSTWPARWSSGCPMSSRTLSVFFGLSSYPVLKMLEHHPAVQASYLYRPKLRFEPPRIDLTGSARTRGDYYRRQTKSYDDGVIRRPFYDTFRVSLAVFKHRRVQDSHKVSSKDEIGPILTLAEKSASLAAFRATFFTNVNRFRRDHRLPYIGMNLDYLSLLRSPIEGFGVFTLIPVPAKTIIMEYVGESINQRLADERERNLYEPNGIGTYCFRRDRDSVLDATVKGNAARFINHSCDPNCRTFKLIMEEGFQSVFIVAIRDIRPMEELTYDYKLPIEKTNRLPCYCGTSICRKFMN